jgi:hypothetical protein
MTTQQPRIRILTERIIETTPRPGVTERRAAITYQIPPRPPNVVFLDADLLPDLVWLRSHPASQEAPAAERARGDVLRRERILANEQTRRTTGVRTI